MSKRGQSWRAGNPEHEAWSRRFKDLSATSETLDASQVQSIEAALRRGAARAHPARSSMPLLSTTTWRLSFAGACALLVLGIWLVQTVTSMADVLAKLQGSVTDGFHTPLCGVQVRNQPDGKLLATTNAAGFFEVAPTEDGTPRVLSIEYEGAPILNCQYGLEPGYVQGYRPFQLATSGLPALGGATKSYDVKVTPGATAIASKRLKLSLDAEARESWQGSIARRGQWPLLFNYGRVVDGIYMVTGDQADRRDGDKTVSTLQLSVQVPLELITTQHGTIDDLRVIAFDPTVRFNGLNYGWYRIDLPRNPAIPPVIPTLTPTADGATLTWPVDIGRQYAIILRPVAIGEITACCDVTINPNGVRSEEFQLRAIDLPYGHLGVYDLQYESVEGDVIWDTAGQPHLLPGGVRFGLIGQPAHPNPAFKWDDQVPFPIGYAEELTPGQASAFCVKPPDLPAELAELGDLRSIGEQPDLNGKYILLATDFTLAEYAEYPRQFKTAQTPPQTFDIQLQPGAIGAMTKLVLQGPHAAVQGQPAWDMGKDGVNDQYGWTAELFAPAAGCYSVSVTIHQKSGLTVRLTKSFNLGATGVMGFGYGGVVPIIDCPQQKPVQTADWLAQTLECVPDPMAYGYSAHNMTGPLQRINLSAKYRNVPLSKLKIDLEVSGLNGDFAKFELRPYVSVVVAPPATGTWYAQDATPIHIPVPQKTLDILGIKDEAAEDVVAAGFREFCFENISKDVERALNGHARWLADPAAQASGTADKGITWLAGRAKDDQVRIAFYEGMGLILPGDPSEDVRLAQMPSWDEIAPKLEAFRNSELSCRRHVTQQNQHLYWTVDLRGVVIDQHHELLFAPFIETEGFLTNGQVLLHSGGKTPSKIVVADALGNEFTTYMDLSQMNSLQPKH